MDAQRVLDSQFQQRRCGADFGHRGTGTASASINTGPITTAANFVGAGTVQTGTANLGILPWAIVSNNGTVSLATSTVIGASGYLRNLAASETNSAFANYVNANAASAANTLSGTATVASTTLTTTNNLSASLYVGESITGAGIAANTYITAIAGSTLTLSAVATVPAASLLTFGSTGVNVALASAANTGLGGTTGQAGTLTQTINSLTLGTQAGAGASLTQPNSNTVLTIANNALGEAILSWIPSAT